MGEIGNRMPLRFALVEDWARYKGGNGLSYHHRASAPCPAAPRVSPSNKKTPSTPPRSIWIRCAKLNKYLDEDYPEGTRPMRLRNSHVVAFVQDDDSTEVLAALECP